MVAAVVALIIMAGALGLLIQSAKLERRQTEMAAMNRDAERVMSQLSTEVRQAGLGRPRGARFLTSTTGAELFPPIVLNAKPLEFTFMADLPRPNSSFNGISYLADDQPAAASSLALLNELNGDCDVYTAALTLSLPPPLNVTLNKCATSARSTLFPSTTPSCSEASSASNQAPSCPWGLNKYQLGEYIILTDNTGKWAELQLSTTNLVNTTSSRKTLALTGASSLLAGMLNNAPNRAVISTPDRVFYRLVAENPANPQTLFRLERKQCWGPLSSSGVVSFTNIRGECGAGATVGTPWEVLLRGLPANGVRFTYWDGKGTDLTTDMAETDLVKLERNLRRVRRVNIELRLRRTLSGSQLLEHSTLVSINVRN
jgi:hypothetical protein